MAVERFEPTVHSVVLPCGPEHFRDFIGGLLGQPQTINRAIYGSFEVSRRDVENLFHLIEQRLSSQNEAELIQFTARIINNDNSSVLLNSLADFQSYNEVKPLISVAAVFSWTYLVKFQGKLYPEKQVIELNFRTQEPNRIRVEEGLLWETALPVGSSIRMRISHTNRTWGTDIEALLTGQLETLLKHETGLRAFVADHPGWIGLITGICVFVSALGMSFRVTDAFIERYLVEAKKFATVDAVTFEAVAKKVDFLTSIVASGMWTRYAFYVTGFFVLAVITSAIVGGIVGSSAGTRRPSFVLLTQRAEEVEESALASYRNSWSVFLVSIAGAVLVGVAGNAAFYFLIRYWTS